MTIFVDLRIEVVSKTGRVEPFYVNSVVGDEIKVEGNTFWLYYKGGSVLSGDVDKLVVNREMPEYKSYKYTEQHKAMFI